MSTARIFESHPQLTTIDSFDSVKIAARNLREGMVILDPELGTPAVSIDHRNRSTRGTGDMKFFVYDYETRRLEEMNIAPATMVSVVAA